MDEQQVKGKKDEVAGTIKEKAGEVTGNKGDQLKGAVQKETGKVRGAVGDAKNED